MKFKKWFRKISILKYPAVFVVLMWGQVPALQPGVSGLKSYDMFFGNRIVKRIDLNKIDLGSHINPSWCVEDRRYVAGEGRTYAGCGFENNHERIVREMNWDGSWSGPKTIYKLGNTVDYSSASEDVMDIARDWEWLEFFYGYGPPSVFGTALIGLAYVHVSAMFFAGIAFILFLTFDAFALAFIFLRWVIKKIKR